ASEYIFKPANHFIEGNRQLYQLGGDGSRFKAKIHLIRPDASHLSADTSNRSVSLVNREPGCQKSYQARGKGDNPKVVPKAVQVMQMKVDTCGDRESELGCAFKPV